MLRDASIDDPQREPRELPVGFKGLCDLVGEFARGREHQDAREHRSPVRFVRGRREKLVKDGECERGGLARARLCAPEKVAPRHHRWDGLRLNGRRGGVPLLFKSVEDGLDEVER
jgi:hypothetical protein